jgi:hypothetical protein
MDGSHLRSIHTFGGLRGDRGTLTNVVDWLSYFERVSVRAIRDALAGGPLPDRIVLCAFDARAKRALESALG